MKNIIHLVVAVVMSTMVYGQDIIERVPPAQTDYETVYGPFEDEICELCLPDGNYNFYTYLVDSVNYGQKFVTITNILNGIKIKVKPVIQFGITYGSNSTSFKLNNTIQTNINKTIDGGNGFGVNLGAGIQNVFQITYNYNNFGTTTWNHSGYTKDIYGMDINELSSSSFTGSKNSYGIKIMPNISSNVMPYVSYSFTDMKIEYKKIGSYEYTDQTYWHYIYRHNISDSFTERIIGTELSIGALVSVYKITCAQILADVKYTTHFASNTESQKSIFTMNPGSTIEAGIAIQF
jgi:hypothetical protein